MSHDQDLSRILDWLLRHASAAAPQHASIDAWWQHFRVQRQDWAIPIDAALAAGLTSDRVGYAFAAGYQAALRQLDPTLPVDRLACLSVTEEGGGHPKAIASTLSLQADGSYRLNGHKRWATLSSSGAVALVAASVGADEQGRNRLRVARVDLGAAGVTIEPMPPTEFVPEVQHGRLHFAEVLVGPLQLLDGDGYEEYVKPFRTLEDLHVGAAVMAYLFGVASRYDWPREVREELLHLLAAVRALALADPKAPAVHVALEGWQRAREGLLERAALQWDLVAADERARWLRDRPLTMIAGRVRAQRTGAAWSRIGASAGFSPTSA